MPYNKIICVKKITPSSVSYAYDDGPAAAAVATALRRYGEHAVTIVYSIIIKTWLIV